MKPSKNSYEPQGDLFKVELGRIVDTKHGLVILNAAGMNLQKLLKHAAAFWRPVRTGRPKSCCHLFFVLSGS